MLVKMKILPFNSLLTRSRLFRRLKLFRLYYGWYFPALERLIERLKQLEEIRSELFRRNENTDFIDGQISVIKSMLLEWYNYKYGAGSSKKKVKRGADFGENS